MSVDLNILFVDGELSKTLQFVDLEIITNAECAKTFYSLVTDDVICTSGAEGRSPCMGDSGEYNLKYKS